MKSGFVPYKLRNGSEGDASSIIDLSNMKPPSSGGHP